jgi:hypothetical protein
LAKLIASKTFVVARGSECNVTGNGRMETGEEEEEKEQGCRRRHHMSEGGDGQRTLPIGFLITGRGNIGSPNGVQYL